MTTVIDPQVTPAEPAERTYSDYAFFSTQFEELLKDWNGEFIQTRVRRTLRYIDIDVKKMRSAGVIKDDEIITPQRVADKNIRREQPSYIAFLTQSRRSLIFRERHGMWDTAQKGEEALEQAFTEGMRFPEWEIPMFKATDGAQTHGWDSVEVVLDETKPLNVGIEHVSHDKLLFPVECLDLQLASYICRGYDLNAQQLKKFVNEFGFDGAQVEMLISADKDSSRAGLKNYRVWKCFFRENGVVYVAWRCDSSTVIGSTSACNDWIKKPEKLYLGRQHVEVVTEMQETIQMNPLLNLPETAVVPVQKEIVVDDDETQYPIYLLRYHETENQQIFTTKGRVFMDQYAQEAQTAIASGFINGLMRASNVYAAVKSDLQQGSSAPPKQLPVKLQHGAMYDKPVDFFHSEYPNPVVLSALQWFNTSNADENGQVDFAVNNRKDSRKTATEIQAASQQAGLLSGVQVTLYSAWVCAVYRRCWMIVQSLAMMDKIKFLQVPDTMTGVMSNNKDIIGREYYVKAAGDVDVVQRAERVRKMQEFWPVISQTAAAGQFLRSMLMTAFPEGGDQWATAIQDDQNAKQLLAVCADLLQNLVMSRPEELAALPPEQKQQLVQLQAQVQAVLNPQQPQPQT